MIESDRNMQQQGMENLMGGLNSAVENIAGAYMKSEEQKAKGRAFKDAFKVIAPSAGIDMKQLEALTGGSLKNDMDWYNARETMVPMLPSLINAQLGSQRNMTTHSGQQIQQAMPSLRNQAANTATVINQGGPSIMGATRRIGQTR